MSENFSMTVSKLSVDCRPVSYTHLDVYKRQVQYSSGPSGRAKKDKHGGWRKTEYSGGNGGYKGVTSEKTVATVTEDKINKYETNRERRSYLSKPTSASREPIASYSYLESKETLKLPEEFPVPNRVVDEEGEAKEEKRSNFCRSIHDNKNTSVDIELQNSKRTSWLNPEVAVFVPVLFVTDPDPVTSLSPTPGDEKSLDGGALPSSVEFNLDIAHGLSLIHI